MDPILSYIPAALMALFITAVIWYFNRLHLIIQENKHEAEKNFIELKHQNEIMKIENNNRVNEVDSKHDHKSQNMDEKIDRGLADVTNEFKRDLNESELMQHERELIFGHQMQMALNLLDKKIDHNEDRNVQYREMLNKRVDGLEDGLKRHVEQVAIGFKEVSGLIANVASEGRASLSALEGRMRQENLRIENRVNQNYDSQMAYNRAISDRVLGTEKSILGLDQTMRSNFDSLGQRFNRLLDDHAQTNQMISNRFDTVQRQIDNTRLIQPAPAPRRKSRCAVM